MLVKLILLCLNLSRKYFHWSWVSQYPQVLKYLFTTYLMHISSWQLHATSSAFCRIVSPWSTWKVCFPGFKTPFKQLFYPLTSTSKESTFRNAIIFIPECKLFYQPFPIWKLFFRICIHCRSVNVPDHRNRNLFVFPINWSTSNLLITGKVVSVQTFRKVR